MRRSFSVIRPSREFVVRLKMLDAFGVIPPHWHPEDENITVIDAVFLMGMGDKVDTSAMKEMPAGSFAQKDALFRFLSGYHYCATSWYRTACVQVGKPGGRSRAKETVIG